MTVRFWHGVIRGQLPGRCAPLDNIHTTWTVEGPKILGRRHNIIRLSISVNVLFSILEKNRGGAPAPQDPPALIHR